MNLQVYNTVYDITERNNNFTHYMSGCYEQEPVDFEKLKNMWIKIQQNIRNKLKQISPINMDMKRKQK